MTQSPANGWNALGELNANLKQNEGMSFTRDNHILPLYSFLLSATQLMLLFINDDIFSTLGLRLLAQILVL